MKKLFYPAIFHKAEEGGFWVTFPDIPECMTQGEDMQLAYEIAWDALGLAITSRYDERLPIPTPSEPQEIIIKEKESCAMIAFDLTAYKRKQNQ